MNVSVKPSGSSTIAPDTTGLNFFRADASLLDLLHIHLSKDVLDHILPHLDRLGELAGAHLDECARTADRHPPVLHHRDRFGRDQQWVEYHPAYRELERVAYGEFGIHAMSHRDGILGLKGRYPAAAKHAFTYLFNQAEFGLGCPINVTDGAAMLLSRFGDAALREKYLDGLTQTDMDRLTQGAQFMTEKEGGSDVGRLTTRAVCEDGTWKLHGEKWFCSNVDAEVAMLLARPDGAAAGTRGLALFLMPRRLDDGSPNHYRIVRLKEKLGTRSMASGEIKLEGAVAYPVGRLDRGFVQMAEMVNWSRLSNGVKSTALMRRALHDSLAVARGRTAFGKLIVDLPLARRQLIKMMLPLEQALSLSFVTADALQRAEGGSQDAAALLRILTPVLKFRATRDARKVCGDALEMRGGVGYIEEFVTARLLRDAHLGSIWEGTGNIVALDATLRAIGRHHADAALEADLNARLDEAPGLPAGYRDELSTFVQRAVELARRVAGDDAAEVEARKTTSTLYHVASAVTLAWEGCHVHQRRGDARRLLLSRLVCTHRLGGWDPFATATTIVDERMAQHLLDSNPVSMSEASSLLC